MYIPKHYNDKEHLLIKKLVIDDGFGSLISTSGGNLYSTLLPFAVDDIAKPTKLLAHMAKSNPQWEGLDGTEVMVQFVGPHAYISPSLCELQTNVPTWNYAAVQVSGRVHVHNNPADTQAVMKRMINHFDSRYEAQYDSLPTEYLDRMLSMIVSFEIDIINIESKVKFSQNKTSNEREVIVESLRSGNYLARELSLWMEEVVVTKTPN